MNASTRLQVRGSSPHGPTIFLLNMGILYILQSESNGRFYVGSTNVLDRRLSEHQRGHTPSTRGRGPWRLVHTEEFPTLLEARRRELEIKRWKSAKLIAALIRSSVG
jgi:putative endonuclease